MGIWDYGYWGFKGLQYRGIWEQSVWDKWYMGLGVLGIMDIYKIMGI